MALVDRYGFPLRYPPNQALYGSGFLYSWSTQTSGAVPVGFVQADNTNVALATHLKVSTTTRTGQNTTQAFSYNYPYQIQIFDPLNAANWAMFTVTGSDGSGLIVTPIATAGSFANGQLLVVDATAMFQATITNDNAAAGALGEYLSGSATGASLSTTIAKNAASVSLTAGDWDVNGLVIYNPAATTNVTLVTSGISATTGAFEGPGTYTFLHFAAHVPGATFIGQGTPGGVRRSLASTTTIFLIARATFTVSTMTADGYIWARRVR